MATHEDLRRIASALPGSIAGEDGIGYGIEQKGKVRGFVWPWKERVQPKKARVPNPEVLAICTPGLAAKEILLASNPEVYFTEPHYNGYPAVLVRLEAIDADELEEILILAWKTKASRQALAEYELDLAE